MTLLIDLFNQQSDVALLALRIAIGTIFLVHGRQKLQMWNMQPNEQMSQGQINFFKFLGVVETLGGISAVFGFLTQLSALGFAILMLGAINAKRTQYKVGFAERQATGWEFDFLILAAAIALIFLGAGAFSLDKVLLNF